MFRSKKEPIENFLQHISILDNGCWEWTGAVGAKGYGRFSAPETKVAHIFSYRWFKGEIPDGLQIDHLCHDKTCGLGSACPHRRCVNPDHLEAVTHQENCRRGLVGSNQTTKTHCPHGHPYDEHNTYHRQNDGGRDCKICRYTRNHARVRRKAR